MPRGYAFSVDVAPAERIAHQLLGGLPIRLAHSLAVGQAAARAVRQLTELDGDLLVPAAILHDIGYSPDLVRTAFHPLDGARWIADRGEHEVAGLVANHSLGRIEAIERGLPELHTEFPYTESLEADVLTYCDLTTGPTGLPVSFDDRVADIIERYGRAHPVVRAMRPALPELRCLVQRVAERLTLAQVS